MTRRTSILSYWTIRYLIIISIGLLLAAAATFWWIREEAMSNRMQTTGLMAQEIADRTVGEDGQLRVPSGLVHLIEDRKRFFKLTAEMCVIVADGQNRLIFSMPPLTQDEMEHKLNDNRSDARSPEFKAATAGIGPDGSLGNVYVLQSKKALRYIPQEEIRFFTVLLLFLIVLSWLTIYLLSRKLAKPIQRVAAAASQISAGQYDIRLSADAKEREIHELLVSFREMAGKLRQFEHSRAVMLAGVSHELKTPVTSIKGLVHAVREGVVEGAEAEEFLDTALHETERLQRMVADLLDYNALTAGMVSVRRDKLEAGPLLAEIVYQWKLTQPAHVLEPEVELPEEPVFIGGDALRIQQIIVNLLNNAVQAATPCAPVRLRAVLTTAERGEAEICIADNGPGVPPENRERIFEAFFSSGARKTAPRGLGLGLTFSRLLAEAMGGALELRPDDGQGCRFALTLPLSR